MNQGQAIHLPSEWMGHQRIILFDGTCRWCTTWIQLVIRHDPSGRFTFSSLQSPPAQRFLATLGLPTQNFETFLLIDRNRIFAKSTAALRVMRGLSGLFPLLYLFILIPRPLRDALYDYVARHRYQWMGKTDTCQVPTPLERDRFV
ncbi:MAG: DCC1-like thiol-disulfide oxidoreductase family protein [Nitrospira sp.]|nr:DCC1-like thiol-disulfide oxidoreductase family protein [Nitrospira sp.]MCP9442797.1 DCC1-like thiol-disulfide oxidoreductase family protein [Nitrospira sp.]